MYIYVYILYIYIYTHIHEKKGNSTYERSMFYIMKYKWLKNESNYFVTCEY